ncbi:MAG: hypothetical protein JNM07_08145 [Phycisphaerae bacterium]|nr:hypothetical protein [Phycisphaerae bacterium]
MRANRRDGDAFTPLAPVTAVVVPALVGYSGPRLGDVPAPKQSEAGGLAAHGGGPRCGAEILLIGKLLDLYI